MLEGLHLDHLAKVHARSIEEQEQEIVQIEKEYQLAYNELQQTKKAAREALHVGEEGVLRRYSGRGALWVWRYTPVPI